MKRDSFIWRDRSEEGLFNDETFDITDLEELARFSDFGTQSHA